jgi:hypothetical protein
MVAWLVSETASLFRPVLSWAVLGWMCFHLGRFDGEAGAECLLPVCVGVALAPLLAQWNGMGWDG